MTDLGGNTCYYERFIDFFHHFLVWKRLWEAIRDAWIPVASRFEVIRGAWIPVALWADN